MKKSIKKIFIQDMGIFTNEILVCVGVNQKEMLGFAKNKKNKLGKEAIKWLERDSGKLFKLLDENSGVSAWNDGKFILVLKEWKYDWDWLSVLLHEVHHIVEQMAEYKMFEKEKECKAYLMEYLFKNIRKKLEETKKKKK